LETWKDLLDFGMIQMGSAYMIFHGRLLGTYS